MSIQRTKALVVLSGGQDSTTCLLWAKSVYGEVHALSFDYGQRHRVELDSARKVAEMVGVASHAVVNVAGLLLGRSPLVNPAAELETYTDYASMDKTIGNRIELTFVPLRNLFFLVVAANYALSKDCYDIVTGVCASDNANYPDCTHEFIAAADFAINEALGFHRAAYKLTGGPEVTVVTPLIHMDKAGIVAMAAEFEDWQLVLAESHTCYAGEVPPCGKCHACVLRAEGFAQAGFADPLVVKHALLAPVPQFPGSGDDVPLEPASEYDR